MSDIQSIFKSLSEAIADFNEKIESENYGKVVEAGNGIAKVIGLEGVFLGEIVKFLDSGIGMVMKIDPEFVSIILFNYVDKVGQGCEIFATKKRMKIKVDESLLGRVINPLGEVLDDLGPVYCKHEQEVEAESLGIMSREAICDPLQTGIKMIDFLIPIGLGQKQLILGDRQSGKTALVLDMILNQKKVKDANGKFAYSIYVSIGKRASEIAKIVQLLKEKNALENTIIVSTTASDSAAMQYIAPMVGAAIGEYFRDKNENALVIFDDLTKHADAYREISLLMKKTPARGAYPGDIFYLHSRLLERAVKVKNGGSVTMLPIIQTLEGDVSGYIPTNVISITDGQIYIDPDIFREGQRPAISIGLSVSRIGSAAQHKNMRKISSSLKGELAQYIEYENFSKSVSDLDESTKRMLARGRVLMKILRQDIYSPLSKEKMLIILYAGINGLLDFFSGEIKKFENEICSYINNVDNEFLQKLAKDNDFSENDREKLEQYIKHFLENERLQG